MYITLTVTFLHQLLFPLPPLLPPPRASLRYSAASPIDTNCYSTAASAACTPTSAAGCTCAPDATFSGSSTSSQIATARDAVIELWDKKACVSTFIGTLQTEGGALKALVDVLEADMLVLQNAIGSAQGAMAPVVENIDVVYSVGSCAFARRRMNGILTNTCEDVLGGVSALGASLLLIGIALYVFLFLLHNCAIARFRMYDVGCWKHDRTDGCCAKDYSEVAPEDNAANIEMVHKYSGGTNAAAREQLRGAKMI